MSERLCDEDAGWPYNLPWPYEEVTYETICAFPDQQRVNRADLLALSEDVDPFYAGREGLRRAGEWFAQHFAGFGFRATWERMRQAVHLRLLQYNWTQRDDPPSKPGSTEVLVNDEACWKLLTSAALRARYLDLVPVEAIEDHKNPPVITWAKSERFEPRIDVEDNRWGELTLPAFPDPPALGLRFTQRGQTVCAALACSYLPFADPAFTSASASGSTVSGPLDALVWTRADLIDQHGHVLAQPGPPSPTTHGFGVTCCAP